MRLPVELGQATPTRGSSLTCTARAPSAGYPENVQPEESKYPDNVVQTGAGFSSPVKIVTAAEKVTFDERFRPPAGVPQLPLPQLQEADGVVRRSSAPALSPGQSREDSTPTRFFTVQDEEAFAMQRLGFAQTSSRSVGASGRLATGSYTVWGEKKSWPKKWVSQDANLTVQLPENRVLVAVFDGHGEGGHHVAGQVKRIFEKQAASIASDPSGPAAGLHRVFAQCQATLESQEDLCGFSGCTASVAVIDPDAQTATLAHVGDSTLVVARCGAVVWATEDHKLEGEAERRIIANGGEVREAAVRGSTLCVRRVFAKSSEFPGLAMSRALGDLEACRLGVLPHPEVVTIPFDRDCALVVASDGLWDVMPREAAAARATSAANADAVARSLVVEARALYPGGGDVDDITAVVVLPRAACAGSSVNVLAGPEGPGSCGGSSPASTMNTGA